MVGALGAVDAAAAPFLMVDIDRNAASQTAAGWTQWLLNADSSNAPVTITFTGLATSDVNDGTFQATLAGFQANGTSTAAIATVGARSRSAPSYTGQTSPGEMLRDFAFVSNSGSQGRTYLTLGLLGLTPNQQYEITVYSYENNGSGQATNWTAAAPSSSIGFNTNPFPAHVNLTNTAVNAVPTTNTGGAAPVGVPNVSAGATFTLTTDANGNAALYAWGGNGADGNNTQTNPYLSGFTVTLVPEPASAALLGAAAIGLGLRRRSASL